MDLDKLDNVGDHCDPMQSREIEISRREAALRVREDALNEREAALKRDSDLKTFLASHNDELRQANEKLVLATLLADELREKAQLAQQRQDDFMAVLAHELRNPLAPIRMGVEVISRSDLDAASSRMIVLIRRQVNHMVRLIDDLLDVSRITRGKVNLQRQVVSAGEFVLTAAETASELCSAKRQRLTINLPREPIYVNGDPVRLSQIVGNLLHNAIKYTPEAGLIVVSAALRNQMVEIRVVDNGEGIRAETLAHVFDMFVQDKQTSRGAQGGLGIGLTVVKKMVELHGGTVEARSEGCGTGSEFIVTLPAAQPGNDVPKRLHNEPAAHVAAHILVVEDLSDSSESLAELLRCYGHEVDIAVDGPQALRLFEQSQPDVVLCDIGLPGMSGYEIASLMRTKQHDRKPTLIALTGYGTQRDIDHALEAGFDHHMVKPANPEALMRLVAEAVQHRA